MFQIALNIRRRTPAVDRRRLRRAVRAILGEAAIGEALVSVAVVDDGTIRELNRRYLGHDEATDVLSFVLEETGDRLEGEIVVSADTAAETAPRFGWSAEDELLLYVIHGMLHLVGYDDTTPRKRAMMRKRERKYLSQSGG